MGLFDRFRKRVHEVAEETDDAALSVEEASEEAQALLNQPAAPEEDDWDDVDEEPAQPMVQETDTDDDDDWDTWDDDEPMAPVVLTKKERKFLERQQKERKKREQKAKKAMKKRGAVDVARPQGSKVDLSMMRTTTGRQLVQVQQAPKGSSQKAAIQMQDGQTIDVDLGGGVVAEGGRIIKPGEALDNLLEELEWVLLESDISQRATAAIIDSLRHALVGARLRKGANLAKVLEAALKRALHALLQAGYWDFDATVDGFIEPATCPWSSCWSVSTEREKPPRLPKSLNGFSTTAERSSLPLETRSVRGRSNNLSHIVNGWAFVASQVNEEAIQRPLLATPSIQRRPKASMWCWSTPLDACKTRPT